MKSVSLIHKKVYKFYIFRFADVIAELVTLSFSFVIGAILT